MYWGMGLLLAILAFLVQWIICRKAKHGWQRLLGLLLPVAAIVCAGVLWILMYTVDTEFYMFGTHFLLVWVYALIASAAFGAGCGAGWLLWLVGRKR